MHPKNNSSSNLNRSTILDQRRALGQCFKCGDRYFPGHQCRVKLQMLMGQQGTDGDEGISTEVIPVMEE
jgi:hypothetical protein